MIVLASTTEELSKSVFGSSQMLAVIAVIAKASDAEFSIPLISRSTGLAPSTIHNQLERLRTARFVKHDGLMPDGRTVRFKRREIPFWHAAAQLIELRELGDSW